MGDVEKSIKTDRKRLLKYALRFKKSLGIGLLTLLIAICAQLYSPLLIKRIFDIELHRDLYMQNKIARIIVFYLILKLTEALFQYISGIALTITAMKVVRQMRLELYHNIQKLSISFFDSISAGTVVSKIVNDTEAVQNLYVKVMGQILVSAVYIIGIYIAIFLTDRGFGIAFLLLFPLLYIVIGFYIKKARKFNNIIRNKIGQINAMINETVQGISIIQIFGGEKRIIKEFALINEERKKQRMNMLYLESGGSYNGVNILKNIAFIIMIYYFGSLVLHKSNIISVGLLYVYIEYINTFFHHLSRILEQLGEMEKAGVAATHVFEMLDKKGKESGTEKIKKVEGEVTFENVNFYYKKGEYVLQNINLFAKKGETVALVGHTGSGKTSVTNLLLKFYEPTSGRILIDQKDIKMFSASSLREHIGIVLQDPFLFRKSILGNITLDKVGIEREDAVNALMAVGGTEILQKLKNTDAENPAEEVTTLSSGQKQLVSFARALAQNPSILILDEATGSVDTETEQLIQAAMRVLMKGRTTFVIAHRLSTIRNADRIYLLDKGQVAEYGTHEELLEKKGKYYEMYRAQGRAESV